MPDDFRDPVGVLVSTRLAVLAEQLRGPMREPLVRAAVDDLMQLQAVCAPDAEAAARMVVESLRATVGQGSRPAGTRDRESRAEALLHGAEAAVDGLTVRLDVLRALAVESFGRHRARMAGIRARELERSRFVERRARERGDSRTASLTAKNPAGGE